VSFLLFSYYLDEEKQHKINYGFYVNKVMENLDGSKTIEFLAYIEEINGADRLRREETLQAFTIPQSVDQEQLDHDIDFIRTRYEPERKWIFEIRNNRTPSERVVLGLISNTATQNPLGMDIYHDEKTYQAELRANNLSKLDTSYIPPALVQTIAKGTFDEPGYPYGFTSLSAKYDDTKKLFELSDFKQVFLDPIPAASLFRAEMDMAPLMVTPKEGNTLFELMIPDMGSLSLQLDRLSYQAAHNDEVVEVNFDSYVDVDQFYKGGFSSKARLTIEGDGKGNLIIQYAGVTIQASYDASKEYTELQFQSKEEASSTREYPVWIPCYLDNLRVIYIK
jgi:hypothetical protein